MRVLPFADIRPSTEEDEDEEEGLIDPVDGEEIETGKLIAVTKCGHKFAIETMIEAVRAHARGPLACP